MLMSNSFDSIAQLLDNTAKISSFLKNAGNYYAHIPRDKNIKKAPETLEAHIELVQAKFHKAVNCYGLDSVIDRLIGAYIQSNFAPTHQQLLGNYIKKLLVNVVVFHDFGKVNENFQADPTKMNNPHFEPTKESPIQTFHSGLSAYIFLVKHLQELQEVYAKELDRKDSVELFNVIVAFSYPIFKHHSSYLGRKEGEDNMLFSDAEIEKMSSYLADYQYNIHPVLKTKLHRKIKTLFDSNKELSSNAFPLLLLLKLSFSLLTASDYLASGEYMLNMPLDEFKVLDAKRVQELVQAVSQEHYFKGTTKTNYNKFSYDSLASHVFQNPQETSNLQLNLLRKQMSIEVIQNIRKHADANLFYIEAPTGGGKTNLSMLATVELLKANPELNQVYYVFPFTTLITQTKAAIIETLGLKDDEVAALHAKAGYKTQEEQKDGEYGKDQTNFIDNLFVNYPFCLLSHIKFFDILKTNQKSTNYLLHRLANSVVVIDELQSYNPLHWDKVIYYIKQYAYFFNIKFVLMSATLPKLDRLKSTMGTSNDFVYLLPNARTDYFQNPNFAKRVSFNFELSRHKNLSLEDLADNVFSKSKAYSQYDFGAAKPLGSVYTIVEFIIKKTATLFHAIIDAKNQFFDEVFVLSGTILEHRRKHIINYLKNPEYRKKRILLITTQVVEAGVDIDMDLGFKDQSLIDSDEQLAGRINRNVNKLHCELYLFQYNKEVVIYGNDLRYKKTKEQISTALRKEILTTKNFDLLYDLVLADIDKWNNMSMAQNFSTYCHNFKVLDFKHIHFDFRLIDQENLMVFIPMEIPVSVIGISEGVKGQVFSEHELIFLKKAKVLNSDADKVDGALVFDLYQKLTANRLPDFIEHSVSIQVLQGLLSKFTFSVFKNKKIEAQLTAYADLDKSDLGFLYLSNWKDIYSIEAGLDDSRFDDISNQLL